MATSRPVSIISLVLFIAVCQGIGFLGSIATVPNIDGWYSEIARPSWTPPDSIFGPVWIFLYITMGVAAWLVWRKSSRFLSFPMLIFVIQLVLNLAWSFLFFGMRDPFLGLIDIVLLWFAILLTIVYFWREVRSAGIILIPYFLWVSFATVLNLYIWQMNKGIIDI